MNPSKEDHSDTLRPRQCPACHSAIEFNDSKHGQEPQYCPYCGTPLPQHSQISDDESQSKSQSEPSSSQATLIQGHVPADEPIQFTVGPYQILHSIGKGGMGEVFLAYDTSCGRRIALKRIRTDLSNHRQLYQRFLKEARITAQLTHPSIIPIYTIHSENNLLYYTMPYVEGETLKQILRKTRRQEKSGQKLDHLGGSIPALIRVFINICQAVAYANSKGVLHRDLKPENIIIGKFGEVLILDWGLAKLINSPLEIADENLDNAIEEEFNSIHELTNTGKVVGTITYMAPERALGHPATVETDIYALGVILYQMLTLRQPFARGTLKEFRKTMQHERFTDPAEIAPYREVPRILSQICRKTLAPKPSQRYHSVEDLIHELENYIEGRSEWFQVAELHYQNKNDWEFQENVLIAEHTAITRHAEVSDWVNLMISKVSVTGNTKVEARIRLGEKGYGIGILLCIPESDEREHLNDGYCLWLSSENHKATKLLRSTVEVMSAPDIFLKRFEWYHVCLEKVDTNIHFYLNDVLQFSYISHSPLVGTHVGLIARDADFEISNFFVYSGSQNIMVNCLAVPDAFLANKDYTKALTEYRRIGYSFPGRAEGREAMFRAGVTLLEQAQSEKDDAQKASQHFDQALLEFEKLHSTPGAPLEYLGKALVYEALHDYNEEIKCYELACRRYAGHPLLQVLQEQIVYRMHESSHHHRLATYNFILLVVRHLPEVVTSTPVKKLFNSLKKHWEHLNFFEEDPFSLTSNTLKNLQFSIILAFWLAKPYVIEEIIDDLLKMENISASSIGNALYALIELGAWNLAQAKIAKIRETIQTESDIQKLSPYLDNLEILILSHTSPLSKALETFFSHPKSSLSEDDARTLLYLINYGIDHHQTKLILEIENRLKGYQIDESYRLQIDCALIWAALLEKDWNKAGELLHAYPVETLGRDTSLIHFLFGCWLYISEGKEIANIHFSGILEVSYPRSWTLFIHYLSGKIGTEQRWFLKSFLWEKRQLYRQGELFYFCIGDQEKATHYHQLAMQEYVHVET